MSSALYANILYMDTQWQQHMTNLLLRSLQYTRQEFTVYYTGVYSILDRSLQYTRQEFTVY